VYALSPSGFKRHIPNPEIFEAYGLDWNDIAPISETELNNYPNAYLIKIEGKDTVYFMDNETLSPIKDLETFAHNGYDWSALHIILQEDADIYKMGSELSYSEPIEQPVVYGTPSPSVSPSVSPTPSVSPSPSPVASIDKSDIVIYETGIDPAGPCADGESRPEYHYQVGVLDKDGNFLKDVVIKIDSQDNFVNTFGSYSSPDLNPNLSGKPTQIRNGANNTTDWVKNFSYIPTSTGLKTITFSSGSLSKTITVNVQ
jgi:hypothetical protein